MKKTRFAAALLLMLACTASSCSQPAQPSPIAFPFAGFMGYAKEAVVEELSLEAATDTGRNELLLEDTVTLLGREYAQLLTFLNYEQYENILGGCTYAVSIPQYAENDLDHAFSLAEALTDQYGVPSTYPGFAVTITALDAASFSENQSYLERWAVEDYDFMEIEMRLLADGNTLGIQLSYQIAGEAVRNNANGEAEHLDSYLAGLHRS